MRSDRIGGQRMLSRRVRRNSFPDGVRGSVVRNSYRRGHFWPASPARQCRSSSPARSSPGGQPGSGCTTGRRWTAVRIENPHLVVETSELSDVLELALLNGPARNIRVTDPIDQHPDPGEDSTTFAETDLDMAGFTHSIRCVQPHRKRWVYPMAHRCRASYREGTLLTSRRSGQ